MQLRVRRRRKKHIDLLLTCALSALLMIWMSHALPRLLPGDFVTAMYASSEDVILSAEQEAAIASSLKAKLGRDVRVTTEIDENLIGGAVIRAGDVVIDGSLRARLEGLANSLIK